MAFKEDLSVFFADFGSSASIGGAAPVPVLFDEAYVSQLGIGSGQPTVMLDAALFAAVGGSVDTPISVDKAAAPGAPLGPNTVLYRIRNVEPEEGLVRLLLERVL